MPDWCSYAAIAAGDPGALIPLLDPDVRFCKAASLPYGVSAVGREATLLALAAVLATWSHIDVTVEECTTAGDLVIAYVHFTGTSRHTGRVYDGVSPEVFRMHAGKIVEWHAICRDTHATRAACDGSGQG